MFFPPWIWFAQSNFPPNGTCGMYVYYVCTVYVVCMYCVCSMHVLCMWYICTVCVIYMYCACSVCTHCTKCILFFIIFFGGVEEHRVEPFKGSWWCWNPVFFWYKNSKFRDFLVQKLEAPVFFCYKNMKSRGFWYKNSKPRDFLV